MVFFISNELVAFYLSEKKLQSQILHFKKLELKNVFLFWKCTSKVFIIWISRIPNEHNLDPDPNL